MSLTSLSEIYFMQIKSTDSLINCSAGFGKCLQNYPRNNHLDHRKPKEGSFAGEYFDSNVQCELGKNYQKS